ncbi:MAG: prepilin-type N-terminal cleavage/methylation domain-containing protein [Planctomycetes bacterium]|nr:prepilin-type N-terminal cleavage/methylation domain-containing protein [Planctomycetota bacterium]
MIIKMMKRKEKFQGFTPIETGFTSLEMGFTLIEILVVIAIIGVLAGLTIPSLMRSQLKAKNNAVRVEIQQIGAALESYVTVFGDYPPSSLRDFEPNLYLNDTNNGTEALVACLSSQIEGGPFLKEWSEERYVNLDNDQVDRNLTDWWFGDSQLRELTDTWGNPYIYFHSRDYEQPQEFSRYMIQGEVADCVPQRSERTATFHNPISYQLWSVGVNGENDNGADDDINNWAR